MKISHFCRFKACFPAPSSKSTPEEFQSILNEAADFLTQQLHQLDITVTPPEWEDFEYTFTLNIDGLNYTLSLSYDYLEMDWFELSYLPHFGPLSRLFGKDETPQMNQLSAALSQALGSSDTVSDVRWYKEPYANPDRDYARTPVMS